MPSFITAQKEFFTSWIMLGKIPTENLTLRTIGIIHPKFSDFNKRDFNEEIIDEWEDLEGKSQSIVEYDKDHESPMMK
jgi:hypothetical protein